MKWNADFEIAAVIVEAVFILFFLAKKHLPTKQNRYFIISAIMAFCMTSFDTLSAYMNSYWKLFPIMLLQVINLVFFLLASALTLSLFLYVLSVTEQLEIMRTPLFVVYSIPFISTELMAIATPFTGFFYSFDPVLGYVHGPGYLIEFIFNCFYLVLAFFYVVVYHKKITSIQRISMYVFLVMLACGAMLQALVFNWVLITNAVTCLALAVVYLSLQNPDMYIDKLTGLFNLDAFTVLAQETVNDGKPFALIGLYFDNLRAMQSLYGEENTNRALTAATLYVKNSYPGSYIFRTGFDRFVMLDRDCMDFAEFSEKIRTRFTSSWIEANPHIIFSPSLVQLPYWQVGNSVSEISNLMDFSMNEMRSMGNGAEVVIDDRIIGRMKRDVAVESAIEKAIEKNSIQVYYQPVYSTTDQKIALAEALARLFDDEVGFIPPDEFIIKAEQNGSIITLGRQIFEKVCIFIRDNDIQNHDIRTICVNLSSIQCIQEELASELISIADEYHIPMSMFDFEITETATLSQKDIVKHNMARLIEAGASFSLDDYGTGFSNLVNILKMPFSYVKIDKSLVWTYFEDENNILPDVIEMFRNQKLGIVIEGVETKNMADRISMMGCELLQGFYYSKPLPPQDFYRLLRQK